MIPVPILAHAIEQYILQQKGVLVQIKLPLTTEKDIEAFEKAINSIQI
jgi:hypothetical protein